jgi:hypothetical protein
MPKAQPSTTIKLDFTRDEAEVAYLLLANTTLNVVADDFETVAPALRGAVKKIQAALSPE